MEQIQVPPERSPPSWLTSLDAIAKWAQPRTDRDGDGDAKFGHVQGPAASGKSTYAPFGLWKALTALCPDMLVVHAVAEYKLLPVQRRREGEWFRASTQNPMFELATMTYAALLRKLKKNTTPTKRVPQPHGWVFDHLPRRVLVILDVDADVSAEFALALAATLTWASSTAYLAGAAVRVLTLSWEPIHPLVKDFYRAQEPLHVDSFSLGADNLTLDTIEAIVIPVNQQGALQTMVQNVDTLGDSSHTVVYLGEDAINQPPGWIVEATQDEVSPQTWKGIGKHRRILPMSAAAKMAGKLTGSDYLHVIVGDTRRRAIFDSQTSQVVDVNLLLSGSERRQQLSWVKRTNLGPLNIFLYVKAGYPDAENVPRRADVASSQISTFIVGLACFQHWSSDMEWAMSAVGRMAPEAVYEVKRRVLEAGLVQFAPGIRPTLDLDEEPAAALSNTLPMVGYDERVARVLSGRPYSRNLVYAKAQLAAVLTVGLRDITHIDSDVVRREDIKPVELLGFTSSIAYTGTLWMVLALIRTVPSLSHDPDVRAANVATTSQAWMMEEFKSTIRTKAQKAMQLVAELASNVLNAHEMPLAPPAASSEMLSSEDVRILYGDFIDAFSHQLAILQVRQDGRMEMRDVVSGMHLYPAPLVRNLIDWRKIQAENNGEHIVGFYTQAVRDYKKSVTVITDWNWIPESTARRWPGYGSMTRPTTMYPLGVNYDEVRRVGEQMGM
ncbi:hypothetical protein QQX98_012184 [Neonectria punicea]|uniref:Uncharacterized protein n=1 Tax=Neonectria punicea TaxID=979145 RepID=A0ABR1GJX1_9HYPO